MLPYARSGYQTSCLPTIRIQALTYLIKVVSLKASIYLSFIRLPAFMLIVYETSVLKALKLQASRLKVSSL